MITCIVISRMHNLQTNTTFLTFTVHGGWGVFGDWQECPVTCGGSNRHRYRECNNPAPQYGGDDCNVDGSTNVETGTCNVQLCPPSKYI